MTEAGAAPEGAGAGAGSGSLKESAVVAEIFSGRGSDAAWIGDLGAGAAGGFEAGRQFFSNSMGCGGKTTVAPAGKGCQRAAIGARMGMSGADARTNPQADFWACTLRTRKTRNPVQTARARSKERRAASIIVEIMISPPFSQARQFFARQQCVR